MDPASFSVRRAVPSDIPLLARHRIGMFEAMERIVPDGDEGRAIREGSERFVARAMASGEWIGFVAEDATGVLGSGATLVRPLAPKPGFPEGGREAYLLNFFTEPAGRRRGVAGAIVQAILDWCAAEGDIGRIELHASEEGRPVYERRGFASSRNHMKFPVEGAGRA